MIDAGRPRRRSGDARARKLSGGQRRRLDVALGIVGGPELLFLDEPTTGFDPEARRQFWALIEDLAAQGTTILLTTHYLDEAEHLADRVGGDRRRPDRRGRHPGRRSAAGRTAAATVALARPRTARASPTPTTPTAVVAELAAAVRRRGARSWRSTRPSLEDIYLRTDRSGRVTHRTATTAPELRGELPPLPPPTSASACPRRGRAEEFFREREAVIFTFVFPIMLLVIFGAVFGDTELDGGRHASRSTSSPA